MTSATTTKKPTVPEPRHSPMLYGATRQLLAVTLDDRTVLYDYNDGAYGSVDAMPLTLSLHPSLSSSSSVSKLLEQNATHGRPIVRATFACGGSLAGQPEITGTVDEQAIVARAVQIFHAAETDRSLRAGLRGIYRRLAANVLAAQPDEPQPTVVPVAADPATRGILAAALAWLYETPQPADASLDCSEYDAPALTVAHDRRLSLTAGEEDRRGLAGSVFPYLSVKVTERTTPLDELLNGFQDDELEALAEVVRSLGYEVDAIHGGPGDSHGGIRLARKAHPTILAAQHYTWLNRCPDHEATTDVDKYFCCDWISRAKATAVRPAWPAAATGPGPDAKA